MATYIKFNHPGPFIWKNRSLVFGDNKHMENDISAQWHLLHFVSHASFPQSSLLVDRVPTANVGVILQTPADKAARGLLLIDPENRSELGLNANVRVAPIRNFDGPNDYGWQHTDDNFHMKKVELLLKLNEATTFTPFPGERRAAVHSMTLVNE